MTYYSERLRFIFANADYYIHRCSLESLILAEAEKNQVKLTGLGAEDGDTLAIDFWVDRAPDDTAQEMPDRLKSIGKSIQNNPLLQSGVILSGISVRTGYMDKFKLTY